MNNRPKVGIGVLILKDNMILLGKRKNAHGEGSWSPPGGHLEYGESWEECALRETIEETGLVLGDIRFGAVTNDIFKEEEKHYLTIVMCAEYISGIPEVREPKKCEAWEWFRWDELPSHLFLPLENLIKIGFNPFD